MSLQSLHEAGWPEYLVIVQNTKPRLPSAKSSHMAFPTPMEFAAYVMSLDETDRTFYEAIFPTEPCLAAFDLDFTYERYAQCYDQATAECFNGLGDQFLSEMVEWVCRFFQEKCKASVDPGDLLVLSAFLPGEKHSLHIITPYVLNNEDARWGFGVFNAGSSTGVQHCCNEGNTRNPIPHAVLPALREVGVDE